MTMSKMDTLKDLNRKAKQIQLCFAKETPRVRHSSKKTCSLSSLFGPRAELCGNSKNYASVWGPFLHFSAPTVK